jgi:hypothetical protein
MATIPVILTNEEIINLMKLSLRADGLSDEIVVANGVLGEQDITAAKKFIEHVGKRDKPTTPKDTFTNVFLANFITGKNLGKERAFNNQYADEAIRIFFSQHGITL